MIFEANELDLIFHQVTRTKNRWKCSLKDGIMHIEGREYAFSKGYYYYL